MGGILSMILPALAPAVTDGLRGLFAKWTGGAGGNPQNVNERIQLMEAETKRLQALAEIDKPSGEPSLWVQNLRGSFRYLAIIAIWFVTAIAIFDGSVPQELKYVLLDLSGASMSFVIGERMYLAIRK
jgi:hypothetical protein